LYVDERECVDDQLEFHSTLVAGVPREFGENLFGYCLANA